MALEDDNQQIPVPAALDTGPGDKVTIDAPDEDESGDDAATPTPASAAAATIDRARDESGRFRSAPKPSRKERREGFKANQGNAEFTAFKERFERSEAMRVEESRRFTAALEAIRASAQPQRQQQDAADPIAEVNAAMSREMKLMQQDPQNFDATTWNKLQERKTELIAEAKAKALIEKHLAQSPRQQDDGIPAELRVRQDTILEQFPEMSGNLPAQRLFRIERQRLQALGERDSLTTDLKAAANTVRDMGLRRSMPARGNQQVAVRRQGPPGGHEGGNYGNRATSVDVPRRMVDPLTKYLNPEQVRAATFGEFDD
jgi:hypothetical protein